MSTSSRAFLALLIASLLWGSAGVAAKLLLKELSPFVINFYRYLIASLIILPFFLKEKKHNIPWHKLILISLLTSCNVNLFYLGLQTTTANTAYLIGASVPLITALLAKLLINEDVSMKKIIGILFGLLGVSVVVVLPLIERGQTISGDFFGNVLIASGLILWTLYVIITRRFMVNDTISPLDFPAYNFFTTTIVSLLFALFFKQQFFSIGALQPMYLGTLLYTSIGVTVLTYVLFNWAVQHVPASTASLKDYLQLFFGFLLNMLLLGEAITVGLFIGGVLIVGGVVIATGLQIKSAIK